MERSGSNQLASVNTKGKTCLSLTIHHKRKTIAHKLHQHNGVYLTVDRSACLFRQVAHGGVRPDTSEVTRERHPEHRSRTKFPYQPREEQPLENTVADSPYAHDGSYAGGLEAKSAKRNRGGIHQRKENLVRLIDEGKECVGGEGYEDGA